MYCLYPYRTAIPENDVTEDARLIQIKRNPASTALGTGIIGGNNIGIFISDIQKNSLAEQSELKPGDQILLVSNKLMKVFCNTLVVVWLSAQAFCVQLFLY